MLSMPPLRATATRMEAVFSDEEFMCNLSDRVWCLSAPFHEHEDLIPS